MTLAFYNEHDPKAAAWLRELIAQGHIAPGVVDERSISDIAPDELAGFAQCHFFAGIGVWPLALRAAGWSDERPIWTGSCPCQPFSAAGKGDGFDDERHLWPDWHWLIEQRRPAVVVGEQVASKSALRWLDLVSTDMEATGYAFGAADLCAAGAGLEAFGESVWGERLSRAIHLCPDPVVAGALRDFADFAGRNLGGEYGGHHIRQRTYFVGMADRDDEGSSFGPPHQVEQGTLWKQGDASPRHELSGGLADHDEHGFGEEWSGLSTARNDGPVGNGPPVRMADAQCVERIGRRTGGASKQLGSIQRAKRFRNAGGVDDASGQRIRDQGCGADARTPGDGESQGLQRERIWDDARNVGNGVPVRSADANAANSRGAHIDWLLCRDGKWRAVESGTFPLAHAAPARVGRLRGYGNALDFETALLWIETVKAHLDGAAAERLAA